MRDSPARLAAAIDHTLLQFEPQDDDAAQTRQVDTLCREAAQYGFAAVCVRPRHVAMARRVLDALNASAKLAVVIAFPVERRALASEQAAPSLGAVSTEAKCAEIAQALADGADELDVVLNIAQWRVERDTPDAPNTARELRALVQAAQGRAIKLILETDLHNRQAITRLCGLAATSGVAMVKTSTGMLDGAVGATPEVIGWMREALAVQGQPVGIKASGGVRTAAHALALLESGATRLGTSAGPRIVAEGQGLHASTVPYAGQALY